MDDKPVYKLDTKFYFESNIHMPTTVEEADILLPELNEACNKIEKFMGKVEEALADVQELMGEIRLERRTLPRLADVPDGVFERNGKWKARYHGLASSKSFDTKEEAEQFLDSFRSFMGQTDQTSQTSQATQESTGQTGVFREGGMWFVQHKGKVFHDKAFNRKEEAEALLDGLQYYDNLT